ncbi:hypothetical protein [Streptomyces cavourensis]|nr:hypothetical protein [Streptomyces cavourensis]
MSSRTVVIGVDSSTQSTKAAVIDAVTGEQLAVASAWTAPPSPPRPP